MMMIVVRMKKTFFYDRRLIDQAMQQTSQPNDVCTEPRRDLTSAIQNMDTNFLESVLPLPSTSSSSSNQ